MMNSHLNHYASGIKTEDIDFHNIKMHQLNYSQQENKPHKQNSSKNQNSHPGSSSNSTSSANGVFIDMGKVLLEAAKCGDSEKVQECVKNGAPFITDWLGTSALHIAAKNNYYDTCATLLRSGISKDAKTKVDRTPLHFAVCEGNFEICQLLLQHECSVDPLDMLKMTPLHWAIEKGFDNIAELLLTHGANPLTISKFLKSPYSIAKDRKNDFIIGMIEMLPQSDFNPNILNSNSELNLNSLPLKIQKTEKSETKPVVYKRERIHLSNDAPDVKRSRPSINDPKNLTLQLLQEQMSMMSNADDNLIESALQSGRRITLTEVGKRLLNDSILNKFLKINTTISSSPSSSSSSSSSSVVKKELSPKSATVTSSRTSDSSDVLEIFRDTACGSGSKKIKPDILNIIRTSSDLQEVTITQRSKTSPAPSPTLKSSISLSAINVPKVKVQQGHVKQKTQLPSSPDANSSDFRQRTDVAVDFNQPEVTSRNFSELCSNYQQLKRLFEREQLKTASLQRQLKQLEVNFDAYKRHQNDKIDSILKLLAGNRQISINEDGGDGLDETEEIL
ncbi:CLUMA_CG003986, isoform A [Clunio marinus]|uniref:CLUMA_CG003986, isoform A n=1 Tax=Clunio marinus TaxID=568069 RepID=A0A1J1HQK6_9DIPT|nr:CLUMA_CG003986, isoform A [Clunio marinus]